MSELRIKKNFLKRQKQLQRYTLIALSTILVAFTLAFTRSSFLSSAKSNSQTQEVKYFTSIVVESGDTLWSIANKNKSYHYKSNEQYVSEVIQMNSLLNEDITVGQYLVIPYYADIPTNKS